jgi:hypothetical protein
MNDSLMFVGNYQLIYWNQGQRFNNGKKYKQHKIENKTSFMSQNSNKYYDNLKNSNDIR